MRILILTDHMPWGHRSIAKALYGHLSNVSEKNGWTVDYVEVEAKTGLSGDLYSWSYRNFPLGNKVAVKLLTMKNLRKMAIEYCDKNISALKEALDKYEPDLVICSYFLHSQAMAKMKKIGGWKFKLWTVVADPWSINTLSFVEGADMHLVYDSVMVDAGKKYGILKNKMFASGWWVREEMYKKISNTEKKEVRRKIGLNDSIPAIFVGGGSLGNAAIKMLLPILLTIRKPVQIVFNTGKDEKLHKMIDRFEKIIKKMPYIRDNLKIINLAWIENMAEILSVCDLILGKAGPNFLFDVVACNKPFVAITHIGGQEDGNIEIIKKKRLGLIAEDPIAMARVIRKFLNSPEKFLEQIGRGVDKEAKNNLETMSRIEKLIKSALLKPKTA